MAKISSKKLIEKLHERGGCGAEPDSWANGWDQAIDKAIEIVSDMAEAAERKKAAKKRKSPKLAKECDFNYCPNCGAKMERE